MEHLRRVPVDPVCSKITAADLSLRPAESSMNRGRHPLRVISVQPEYVSGVC